MADMRPLMSTTDVCLDRDAQSWLAFHRPDIADGDIVAVAVLGPQSSSLLDVETS